MKLRGTKPNRASEANVRSTWTERRSWRSTWRRRRKLPLNQSRSHSPTRKGVYARCACVSVRFHIVYKCVWLIFFPLSFPKETTAMTEKIQRRRNSKTNFQVGCLHTPSYWEIGKMTVEGLFCIGLLSWQVDELIGKVIETWRVK